MAHNLAMINGKVSFAEKGKAAWHGLGTSTADLMSSIEVLKLAGLDYTVEKQPIYIKANGEDILVPNTKANVRLDNNAVLGIVSDRYQVLQNEDCLGFFDELLGREELIYETAGAIGKGEKSFLLCKTPKDIKVKGDEIKNYILLVNGFDGRTPFMAMFTKIRVVCENTLNAALKSARSMQVIYHQINAKDKLKQAYNVLGLESEYTKIIENVFVEMAKVKISNDKILEAIPKIIFANTDEDKHSTRAKNIIENVYEFTVSHPSQQTDAVKNTAFGLYNGITGYLNWEKKYKSASDKMNNIYFGSDKKLSQKAFEYCNDL